MPDWSAFEYLTDAILVIGAGGTIHYANPPAEALFGYERGELSGVSMGALLSPEQRVQRKDGSELVLEVQYTRTAQPDMAIARLRAAERTIARQASRLRHPESAHSPTPRPDSLRREAHLAAVVEVQRLLLTSEGKNLPMNEICSILGAIFHVSRVYLVENAYDLDERMYLQRQFEWCAANIPPLMDDPAMQHQYYDDVLPNWRRHLSQGKMVGGILADLPSAERRFLIPQGIQAILIFPLMVSGRFSGFLAFDDCLIPRQWQPSEISLLQVVTTSLAMVRERLETEDHLISAYRELSQRLVELSTLNEIIQTLATITDVGQMLELIAIKTSVVFEATHCSIALLNSEQNALRVIVDHWRTPDQVSAIAEPTLLDGSTAFQHILEQQQSLVITNAQENPLMVSEHELLKAHGIRCVLITPLLSRGQFLGVIRLSLDDPDRTFSPSEIRLAETIAGQVAGAIENVRLIDEAEQARKAAVSSNQAKSAFLASMSHELRTPLNAILGFTQLLLHAPNLTIEQVESLSTINRSGDHLLSLINDILDLSKIEAGRITLQESEFDLHHLLHNIEDMFALRVKSKGLLFRLLPEPNTPRYVLSDESKLRQILINLLGNAIKFTSRGSITLAIRAKALADEGVKLIESQDGQTNPQRLRLILEVSDTGIGIPDEDLDRIFEPFVQSQHGQRVIEGTGLGLSISREYARLLGGDITATSRLGYGSTFFVNVLIGKAASGDLPITQTPSRVTGLAPGQEALRILVAEDNESNRQLMVLLLSAVGFEVRGVDNGVEAVQIVRDWKPHLVWMDLRMPLLDGLEATRQIKTANPQAPVIIALTASVLEDKLSTALDAGCDDYLSKPYHEADIFELIERHLGVRFLHEISTPASDEAAFQSLDQALVTGQSLAALPSETLNRLGQAAFGGDINSLEAAIQEIRSVDAALASSLDHLANQFEYGKIHTLTQEALQERH